MQKNGIGFQPKISVLPTVNMKVKLVHVIYAILIKRLITVYNVLVENNDLS